MSFKSLAVTALLTGTLALPLSSLAADVEMQLLSAKGDTPIGTVSLKDSSYGLVISPHLTKLTPGMHGFHIHAKGSCGPADKNGKTVIGGGAGGHFDPSNTGKHGLPWTDTNHKGDLPALYVDDKGEAHYPVLAPRLTLKDVVGKAIIIHAGGDNHSDTPAPLGGGGARMACGVIK